MAAFPLMPSLLELDGRKPWSWPRAYQQGIRGLGVILGVGLLMPMTWSTWQAWRDAGDLQTAVHEQVRNTQALQAATAALQAARVASAVGWGTAAALATPTSSPGLQWMQQAMASPQHTSELTAMQLQQVPVRLQARGSWRAWLEWLERWPHAAPGGEMASLVLEVDEHAGIRADMTVLVTQHTAPVNTVVTRLASNSEFSGGPFDAVRWTEAQHRHARQHASYNERVVPELRRAREPLEFFARERLHYVGQIAKGADVQALLRVDDAEVGKARTSGVVAIAPIHRVRVGSRVGQHFGRVSAITADALWVKELVLAPSGEWVHRDIQLALQVQVP